MNTKYLSVLCTLLMLCSTLNAKTNMNTNSNNAAFSYVDMRTFKSHNSNPWGLVYQGAGTRNEEGKVNLHAITYPLNGLTIAANVYTPRRLHARQSLPRFGHCAP